MTRRGDGVSTKGKTVAARSARSGRAEAEASRRDSAKALPIKRVGDVWVFDLPSETPVATSHQVKQLLDDEDRVGRGESASPTLG